MKHQALLTIQAKLKLAIILFYFSVAIDWQIPRKRVAREARKLWSPESSAIPKYIQLVFCCVMEKLLIFNICEI